jgi:hypothetical protein
VRFEVFTCKVPWLLAEYVEEVSKRVRFEVIVKR